MCACRVDGHIHSPKWISMENYTAGCSYALLLHFAALELCVYLSHCEQEFTLLLVDVPEEPLNRRTNMYIYV